MNLEFCGYTATLTMPVVPLEHTQAEILIVPGTKSNARSLGRKPGQDARSLTCSRKASVLAEGETRRTVRFIATEFRSSGLRDEHRPRSLRRSFPDSSREICPFRALVR